MRETDTLFDQDIASALEAKGLAQAIAFGPVVFQAARVLRNSGILAAIDKSHPQGVSISDIRQQVDISEYGARVLLESALSAGLVIVDSNDHYNITKTGYFILHDDLTRVNMDFVHDVCYKAMYSLDKSIENGKPVGLSLFGDWETIYEGLSQLPKQVQKSWFAFDHYFSDDAFDKVLEKVMANNPRRIVDIGGNTGKFSLAAARYNPDVEMMIMDLPGQLGMAKSEIENAGLSHRIHLHAGNILHPETEVPAGFDAIWMSQFLDCFSEAQIVSILEKCYQALGANGQVFIMEPFWDCQKFRTAAFCLHQTSLYFTALANGNSQMYSSRVFKQCLDKTGFRISEQIDEIGLSQTLLICEKK